MSDISGMEVFVRGCVPIVSVDTKISSAVTFYCCYCQMENTIYSIKLQISPYCGVTPGATEVAGVYPLHLHVRACMEMLWKNGMEKSDALC